MESRKIQKVGAATLTVSLPKEWAGRRNLKKGDQVFLVEEGDVLKVLPGPPRRSGSGPRRSSWWTRTSASWMGCSNA